MKQQGEDNSWGFLFLGVLGVLFVGNWIDSLGFYTKVLYVLLALIFIFLAVAVWFCFFSKFAKDKRKRIETYSEIPSTLKEPSVGSVTLGRDTELLCPIYLPVSTRSRHVHILGSTGSGKTESVILNLLKQDIELGRGAIILDAKGDNSFKKYLKHWVPNEKLCIMDLGDPTSTPFNPNLHGSPVEAAQRLHSSLTWSEEYYKSKSLTALLRLFDEYNKKHQRNPTLKDLNEILYNSSKFTSFLTTDSKEIKVLDAIYEEISGLSDQIKALSMDKMETLLSPSREIPQIELSEVSKGKVFYFRLQNLMAPETVAPVGKLIISNINHMAGATHRGESTANHDLVPVYLDEFAAFASPMFTILISMARSAKFALHFSHQSIGDLMNINPGFVSQITDNSGTKIILRVNDPDTAEYFARSFGTREIVKITQRLTNTDKKSDGELVGEGSARDAHKFRAAPDLLKTLPTGMAACLIAHGEETKEGASHVFKLKFPRLEET